MKSIKKSIFFLVVIILLLAGCEVAYKTNKYSDKLSEKHDGNNDEFNIVSYNEYKVKAEDIDELGIYDSKILKEDWLNIIKVEDGILYGLAHKPSGDGIKFKSIYKFDFDGNISEKIEEEYYIDDNFNTYQFVNNNCYYIQETSDNSMFMKLDYNNMCDEHLFSVSGCTPKCFYVNNNELYYILDYDKLCRRDLSTDTEEILYEFSNNSYKFFIDDEVTYIFSNKLDNLQNLIKLDKLGEQQILIEDAFKLINKIGNYIYYIIKKDEDMYLLCCYDIKTREHEEIDYIGSNNVYNLGKIIVFLYNDNATLGFWQPGKKEEVYKINQNFENTKIIKTYKDRYVLYQTLSDKIGIIDKEKQVNYLVNISEIKNKIEVPSSFIWYMDDNYLYVQIRKEIDCVLENTGDKFYRVKLNSIID